MAGVWRSQVAVALMRVLRRKTAETWLPLEAGWSVAATDELEVQVVPVAEIGWRVELRNAAADEAVGRPTFSRRLEDATRIARYLRARYARGPSGVTGWAG